MSDLTRLTPSDYGLSVGLKWVPDLFSLTSPEPEIPILLFFFSPPKTSARLPLLTPLLALLERRSRSMPQPVVPQECHLSPDRYHFTLAALDFVAFARLFAKRP